MSVGRPLRDLRVANTIVFDYIFDRVDVKDDMTIMRDSREARTFRRHDRLLRFISYACYLGENLGASADC